MRRASANNGAAWLDLPPVMRLKPRVPTVGAFAGGAVAGLRSEYPITSSERADLVEPVVGSKDLRREMGPAIVFEDFVVEILDAE